MGGLGITSVMGGDWSYGWFGIMSVMGGLGIMSVMEVIGIVGGCGNYWNYGSSGSEVWIDFNSKNLTCLYNNRVKGALVNCKEIKKRYAVKPPQLLKRYARSGSPSQKIRL